MSANQQTQGQKFCFECGSEVRSNAFTCPHCGVLQQRSQESSKPALALALNFFFPGSGLMFYKQMALGIVMLVLTVISFYTLWLLTMPISMAMTANLGFAPRPEA